VQILLSVFDASICSLRGISHLEQSLRHTETVPENFLDFFGGHSAYGSKKIIFRQKMRLTSSRATSRVLGMEWKPLSMSTGRVWLCRIVCGSVV
jgi:hypothetical protein